MNTDRSLIIVWCFCCIRKDIPSALQQVVSQKQASERMLHSTAHLYQILKIFRMFIVIKWWYNKSLKVHHELYIKMQSELQKQLYFL